MVAGANTVWAIILLTPTPPSSLPLLIVIAGVAALLPDIEARDAKAQHISIAGAEPLRLFRGAFAHRGFTHSLIGVAIVGAASFAGLRQFGWDIPLALTLGYASHPLVDAFNPFGVRFLYPSRIFYRFLPRVWCFPIGRYGEQLLLAAGIAGLLFLLFRVFVQMMQAAPSSF